MRIYVASSWRNAHQLGVVVALRMAGHDVFDFRNPAPGVGGFAWSDIDPDWKGWSPHQFGRALNHPIAIHGYLRDYTALRGAELGVLVLPCGRSAHLEAGYMIGAGKPVVIYMPEAQEPELMYRLSACMVYDIPTLVSVLQTIQTRRDTNSERGSGERAPLTPATIAGTEANQ